MAGAGLLPVMLFQDGHAREVDRPRLPLAGKWIGRVTAEADETVASANAVGSSAQI